MNDRDNLDLFGDAVRLASEVPDKVSNEVSYSNLLFLMFLCECFNFPNRDDMEDTDDKLDELLLELDRCVLWFPMMYLCS